MAAIRHKDTKPEMLVRRLIHSHGFRYRLHKPGLPGKPDLVFAGKRKVIFVHGCFWHLHPSEECKDARKPKSNVGYWRKKLEGNVQRDKKVRSELIADGWEVLTVWECETGNLEKLKAKLFTFLA
ncbi:very short patch repair endonuclease [Aquisalinus flavus]|uniref:very short patch repair endonuclease n=1 Tax=Aquisalinus flavus TaxID=1526572 RepID=UPI0019D6FF33